MSRLKQDEPAFQSMFTGGPGWGGKRHRRDGNCFPYRLSRTSVKCSM